MLAVASSSPPAVDRWQSATPTESSVAHLSAACALLAVLVQTQTTSQSGSKTDVEVGSQQLEQIKKELADAVRQAKEAAEDSGFFGFLGDIFGGDIAKIAGLIAAAAATIATAGAGAPILLVALSAALELGAKVGAELGLDPKICTVLSLAGAVVGMASGVGVAGASNTLVRVASKVEVGAHLVEGSATMAGGVLHGVSGHYQAEELHHRADATGIHARDVATQMDIDRALALLEKALRTQQSETNTVSQIARDEADSNSALCDRI